MIYKLWLRIQADAIGSDGCTHALELARDCCLEHDLGYYYGRDPRSAYRLFRQNLVPAGISHFDNASPITRGEVDARFRRCNPPLVGWYRWIAVRIGGRRAWKRHRSQRP